MLKSIIFVFVLFVYASLVSAEVAVPAKFACVGEASIRAMIDNHVHDNKFEYAVVNLDGANLKNRLNQNQALEFPLLTKRKKIIAWREKAKPFNQRDPLLTQAYVNNSATEIETVSIGASQSYKFNCNPKRKNLDRNWGCGQLNFLNSTGTQYEGLFYTDSSGLSVVESAESLLSNLRKAPVVLEQKCAVIYNVNSHAHFDIDGDFGENSTNAAYSGELMTELDQTTRAIKDRTYGVHLDGDSEFLAINEDNWFLRMESVIGGANFSYNLIEPLTGKKFKILLRPRTLQVWNNGFGPTETDKDRLIAIINDPSYRREVGQTKNQLFYYFVGYDLDGGAAGIAGSICNDSDFDGFGDAVDFQDTRALGQQVPDVDNDYEFATYYGRIVVAIHELGHILGGRHEDGVLNQCAGGLLPRLCGTTVMLSGASGGVAPDFRELFFSRRNDNNIVACIRHADDL